MWKLLAFVALSLGTLYMLGYFSPVERPTFKADGWWGRGKQKSIEDQTVRPFTVNVSDTVLKDLQRRLQNARLGEDLEDSSFEYGFQVEYMKKVIKHWMTEFDWRKQEAILNSFPQFTTNIEGIEVHFLRVKPAKETKRTTKAVLLSHGWPGSVWEFHKIIRMLTNPAEIGLSQFEGLEVICPSIPGYGFSEAPHQKGFDITATARVFVKLMKRLGHDKFYVQGGDWGSAISAAIATIYPQNTAGLHLNVLFVPKNTFLKQILINFFPSFFLTKQEAETYPGFLTQYGIFLRETGYMHLQATRPDTVAFGLNDSPVGLAAYILEKVALWTKNDGRYSKDGGLTEYFTLDDVLTNVMIYWVTDSIGPSMRYYLENFSKMFDRNSIDSIPIDSVPTGFAMFKDELYNAPICLGQRRYPNMIHHSEFAHGGHFAAWQVPETLAEDLLTFVEKADAVSKHTKKEL